jgi:hypothetical protein
MPTLATEHSCVAFDDRGNLTELRGSTSDHNYAGGRPVWRLYFRRGDAQDCEALPPPWPATVEATAARIRLHYDHALHDGRPVAFAVTVEVTLAADGPCWGIAVANRTPDLVVTECHFPLITGLNLRPGQELIWSKIGGERLGDLRQALCAQHTAFMGPDYRFTGLWTLYPGLNAAANCYLLAGQDEGLYCGCHDPAFEYTAHSLRLYGDDLEAGFARYPTLAPGDTWRQDSFVVTPYQGSWHAGADHYRRWAATWFRAAQPPGWVRTMPGWQRIIMKHQYGDIHYRYDDLPRIREEGRRSGIDALFMFGWWAGGMDNANPEYVAGEDLGGPQALADGITAFQRDGGAVILYSSGKLIDTTTDFYRRTGQAIAIKDALGNEVREAYRFRWLGTRYPNFGNRTFAVACPACEAWWEVLKGVADTAHRLGCRAVFYDQLGMGDQPCCDPTHGHPVPFMGITKAKADLAARLRAYVKGLDPAMAIGVEWVTDVGAQHADFVHSLSGFCGIGNDGRRTGEKPRSSGFIDFFRYLFPEVIMSDREIRDDTDIERRLNHALLKGLRSDVEIYRCRRTIAAAPAYATYLAAVNALRQRQARFLLEGTYRDTLDFALDNDQVDARAYVAGGQTAVCLTQSHLETTHTVITMPGGRLVTTDGLGSYAVTDLGGGKVEVRLDRHAFAVAILAG